MGAKQLRDLVLQYPSQRQYLHLLKLLRHSDPVSEALAMARELKRAQERQQIRPEVRVVVVAAAAEVLLLLKLPPPQHTSYAAMAALEASQSRQA